MQKGSPRRGRLFTCLFPFFRKDGVLIGILPQRISVFVAEKEHVFLPLALAAHPQPLHQLPGGGVARIALDTMLRSCGVNQAGLWSMSRGFAKTSEQYKASLANADAPRKGALDGRGNLSEEHLAAFISYGMQTAIDQATFMAQMFALDKFAERVDGYLQRVRFDLKPESRHLILHAFSTGEFDRGEAPRLTGLAERTARDVLGGLLKEGFLQSDSPKGKVRIGYPVHALGSLFPNLYPPGVVDIQLNQLRNANSSRSASVAQALKKKSKDLEP